jgi:hypothetical protein
MLGHGAIGELALGDMPRLADQVEPDKAISDLESHINKGHLSGKEFADTMLAALKAIKKRLDGNTSASTDVA